VDLSLYPKAELKVVISKLRLVNIKRKRELFIAIPKCKLHVLYARAYNSVGCDSIQELNMNARAQTYSHALTVNSRISKGYLFNLTVDIFIYVELHRIRAGLVLVILINT
jgi:hypothetical protein